MIRSAWFGVLAGALLLAAPTVQAVSIGLAPVGPTISVGDTVEVSIEVSGLGNVVAPSLGGFDISIGFDATVLEFQGFVFGNQLDLLGLGSMRDTTPGAGSVGLFELSLDSVDDLVNLQAGDFALGVLTFRGIAGGISSLQFSLVDLADENGDPLDDVSVAGGRVTVEGTALPEPGTLLLVGPAALALTAIARKRRRSSVCAA